MMCYQPPQQHKLFITGFNLEERIRKTHVLRKIAETIDFNFVYQDVKEN